MRQTQLTTCQMYRSPEPWQKLVAWRYLKTQVASACTAMNQSMRTVVGAMRIAESYTNMNTEKIKNTLEEFKKRDAERVTDMQQAVIEAGGDLGPDMVLMMMVDRLKDLSTLVAVMAKEMIGEDEQVH